MSDSAHQLLDIPRGSAGRSVRDLGLDDRLQSVLTSGTTESDQLVLVGDRLLVLNTVLIESKGRTIGSVTTFRDRTELRSVEEELDVTKTSTDALRAHIHEFDNQLHTISGLIQLGEYDEVVGYVEGLTMERAQVSATVTEKIADVGTAALVIAKIGAAAQGLVTIELAADTHLETVDRRLGRDLVTVVGNLVDNAVDAVGEMPEASRRKVRLSIRGRGTAVEVRVEDAGPGIAPENRDRVFGQGWSTKGQSSDGHGFGLALVRLTCRRRGGDVHREHSFGRGHRVDCLHRSPTRRRGRMIRVLVVDDDFMVAKVHSGFVSRIDGFEVCGVAHSAETALAAVGELQPDLVLLDVHLPGTTGLDLIAPFRELAPELDVLVITSEREAGSVKKALRSGVVHYLMKPFTFEVLRERLERYRSTYANLDSSGEAEQTAVDEAFGVAGGAPGASSHKGLPKGLSPETLRLVETALRDDTEPASATDISERVGISRASARRYLEYLYESGRSTTSLKYGVVGPPGASLRLETLTLRYTTLAPRPRGALVSQYRARSAFLSSLPSGVSGSDSTKSMLLGA